MTLRFVAVWAVFLVAFSGRSAECLVFLGTYTGTKSKGIYVSRLDRITGALSTPQLVAETKNPSFLALHPNGKFLYAVGEVADYQGKKAGSVSAFSIDRKTGKLTALNQQSSGGDGPCHLVVDRAGKHVLVANYGGGSVAAIAIKRDGSLGEQTAFIQHTGKSINPARQQEPHGHSINLDKENRFAIAADLGLDKLLVYRFDQKSGNLGTNDPPFATVKPGAGPRHFAFHPKGHRAYIINELHCTVTAFEYDAKSGVLTESQTISTLPPREEVQRSYSTAEVQVHPSGRFVYGSNRGHDSIVVYALDQNEELNYVENEPTQGRTPRNFGIDPSGKFLLAANQNSDNVVAFRIDEKTGALTPAGQSVEAPTPVCVKFLEVK
ncbi:MAG: lactonase family protein [Verrucomicrobia subdivision 3 bacterium]|nr:lactonase family protein [Limisphaerales bacterium]